MKQWLIMMLANWLKKHARRNQPEDFVEEEEKEEEVLPPCPICGMEWEKGETFCYICGYEQKDENLPLHPPPERTGALTDPGQVLMVGDRDPLRSKLDDMAESKGIDLAVLVLPPDLRQKMKENMYGGQEYSADGIAYCMYNSWRMGKDTKYRGILLLIDPDSPERAMVTGRGGPTVSGSDFRSWYESVDYPEELTVENRPRWLATEIEQLAMKLESIPG